MGLILRQDRNKRSCLLLQPETPAQGFWLTEQYEESNYTDKFTEQLNKKLTNAYLIEISITEKTFDRIIKLNFTLIDRYFGYKTFYTLICEFTGRISNIILCDENNIVIDMLKRTSNNKAGSQYTLPDSYELLNPFIVSNKQLQEAFCSPSQEWLNKIGALSPSIIKEIIFRVNNNLSDNFVNAFKDILKNYELDNKAYLYMTNDKLKLISSIKFLHLQNKCKAIEFDNVNSALVYAENDLLKNKRIDILKKQILQKITKDIKYKKKLLQEQQKLLDKYENAYIYENIGNLILSNIHKIKLHTNSVTLVDWQTNQELKIKLNPEKSPSANAERYFKLYKKAKRGVVKVKSRIETLTNEIKWLNEQLWLCKNAERETDIEYKPGVKHTLNTKKSKNIVNKRQKQKLKNIKPYLEINDCLYYVGKNSIQNDLITFKIANKNDYWFHANDVPGAHVIMKKIQNKVTQQDLYLGALLAAWFSFAKNSGKAAVDYTLVGNVKRIAKGGPGLVSYTEQKTLFVNPQDIVKYVNVDKKT